MRILGFQKTTLLDYPHKLASTIFLGGCNFRCPFCHNALLVTEQTQVPQLSEDNILNYLQKRVGILEGVCITGGEPTLSPGVVSLIKKIKSLGYSIKLDTNGTNPDLIAQLIQDRTIDYIAMDIKNAPDKYSLTAGANVCLPDIQKTIDLLLHGSLPYEFRTTVVRELHTREDFIRIGQWIHGASQYYLQNFIASDHLICPNQFTSYEKAELNEFCELLRPQVSKVALRGID